MSAALRIERVKITDLTPDAALARLYDRRNLDAIKAGFVTFGQNCRRRLRAGATLRSRPSSSSPPSR